MTVASTTSGLSLSTGSARNLATTTKSAPYTAQASPRWLLRMLPWVGVDAATYRVNHRLSYRVGDGRVAFVNTGSQVRVIPAQLRELPPLHEFDDGTTLAAIADRCTQREFAAGDRLAAAGEPCDRVLLLARGLAHHQQPGEYDVDTVGRVLGHGDHAGSRVLHDPDHHWETTLVAVTPGTLLELSRRDFNELAAQSPALQAHLARLRTASPPPPQNRYGEAEIALAAGHAGEPDLPGTFVDYETAPRQQALSVAQTGLRVHTRVSDIYREPMDQIAEQLRLTVTALRERQEYELVNNPEFGLLHNADLRQRLHPRSGPPTPADLDQLLARRRRSDFFLAHPRTITAFGRECTRRGIYPRTVRAAGVRVAAWRGVPLLPCDKIPITDAGTSSVLVMRTGEEQNGVVGLRPTTVPDEHEPGLSVRLAGVDDRGIARYLVSAYYAAAVLVPDALGVLEHVQVSNRSNSNKVSEMR